MPCDESATELNSFLSTHRVLRVREEVVMKGADPYLVFIVEYLDGKVPDKSARPPKVDYREELSDAEFAVFSALRDWRKTRAEEEGAPVYTIFTNAQLAEMVRTGVGSLSALGKVEGVGKARVEKYGEPLLNICKDFTSPERVVGFAAKPLWSAQARLRFESGVEPPHSKRFPYEAHGKPL